MYDITVPVMNSTVTKVGREETLAEIKKFAPKRVLLAFETLNEDEAIRKAEFENLRVNTEFFKAHGYEVGAWIVPLNSGNEAYQDMILFHAQLLFEDAYEADHDYCKGIK